MLIVPSIAIQYRTRTRMAHFLAPLGTDGKVPTTKHNILLSDCE